MSVIDGTNLILGRLASNVAKMLLKGEEVHIINAEKIRLIGNSKSIVDRYLQKRRLQNKGTPEKSPHYSRVPHLFVKRVIRGMVPWKKATGKNAIKRLRVYSGNPKDLKNFVSIEEIRADERKKSITVYEVCKQLGYN
ncbi:MAG TPA: 50S ribosomal protein L13 [Candidatus Bilamarchaeaceae archaeon]|nr:50S ribosomal protein L13 [Candidatus Bilamarchaeaceae archaeon]